MQPIKYYLGDGVYITFDGSGLELTTEDGARTTNTIYLETFVYEALVEFVTLLEEKEQARMQGK